MARKVICSGCGAELIVAFLDPGESVHCRRCQTDTEVKESDAIVEAPVDALSRPLPATVPDIPDGAEAPHATAAWPDFAVGKVLSTSFGIYFQNFGPILILTVLIYLPWYLLFGINFYNLTVAPRSETGGPPIGYGTIMFLSSVVSVLLSYVMTGALIYGVFQRLRNRAFNVSRCITVALQRFLPIVGVSLVAGLAAGLAALLLIIPGLVVYCTLWVAVPATVVERTGVFASLRRSAQLTKGYRFSIFGVMLVYVIVAVFGNYVLNALVGALLGGLGASSVWLLGAVDALISSAIGALSAVITAVGYYELRTAQEGIGVEQLVEVFD